MVSFKVFFEKNEKFSQKENVNIIDVGTYKSKIDSGNDGYCVLHGTDIEYHDDKVTFIIDNGKKVTKPYIEKIKVNVGAETTEDRPLVLFDIKIRGRVYKDVKFSIGNRDSCDEKVLIGLKFLKPLKANIKIK